MHGPWAAAARRAVAALGCALIVASLITVVSATTVERESDNQPASKSTIRIVGQLPEQAPPARDKIVTFEEVGADTQPAPESAAETATRDEPGAATPERRATGPNETPPIDLDGRPPSSGRVLRPFPGRTEDPAPRPSVREEQSETRPRWPDEERQPAPAEPVSPEWQTLAEIEPSWYEQPMNSWPAWTYWDATFSGPRGRHKGVGCPLSSESWLYRPIHVGWFFGPAFGQSVTENVSTETGWTTGLRLGWDLDHYFSAEFRASLTELPVDDDPIVVGGVEYDHQSDPHLRAWDFSLLYYPWGDSKWRPYGFLGVGLRDVEFRDESGEWIDEDPVIVPWGIGVKYRYNSRFATRVELLNTLSFETGEVDGGNDVAITLGFEYHFGGRRKSYWPWTPTGEGL